MQVYLLKCNDSEPISIKPLRIEDMLSSDIPQQPPASLLSSWTPLADLPKDYGRYENREQAIAMGVYVNMNGIEPYNQQTVDAFFLDVSRSRQAFMRTIQ